VKGWDGGAAWINSQTVIARENFAAALTHAAQMASASTWLASVMSPNTPQSVAARLIGDILQGDASPASIARIESYLSGAESPALGGLSSENFEERVRGAAYLAMATPAYQLS
jgi:uncharacterized protein (DUF1800 family)